MALSASTNFPVLEAANIPVPPTFLDDVKQRIKGKI